MLKSVVCDSIFDFLTEKINQGEITFSSVAALISPEGAAFELLQNLLNQFKTAEATELAQLEEAERNIISLPKRKLLSKKMNGCDFVAAAVKQKYSVRNNVTACRVKQAVVKKWMEELSSLTHIFTRAYNIIGEQSANVKKSIAEAFVKEESSLVDFDVMEKCYHKAATDALDSLKSAGNYDLRVCDYIFDLSNDSAADIKLCIDNSDETGAKGMELLEKKTADLFDKLLNQSCITKIFKMNYDEELYYRYAASDTNQSKVNEILYQKLDNESTPNLRYTVFGGGRYTKRYCIGNVGTNFVQYVKSYSESISASSSNVGFIDIGQKTIYEQISLAGNIDFDGVEYFKDYQKLLSEYDNSYIIRGEIVNE